MPKWLELTQDVGENKAGKFLEVEDNVHTSYIGAGLAKDGGDGPETVILQRALDRFGEKLQGFVTGTADRISAATEAIAKRPNVRVETVEDESDKTRGIGDFMRCTVNAIGCAMTGDFEGAKANHERLVKVYKVQRTGAQGDSLIQRNMTESTGSSLGYTTPVIYESMILKEAAEEQVFLPRARRVPLGARETQWPALNQYQVPNKGQSAMFGGVQVYRKGEATQRTVSDVKTTKVTLFAQDMTAFFELSRDSMQDSTAVLDAMIPMLGGQAIGWRSDWEAWQGSGSGQMLGIVNAPCTILVTRNTASHIKYQDVFTMYTRLLPRAKAGACWFVHPFAMNDVMQLQDPAGHFIYFPILTAPPEGQIGTPPSGRLLGLPLYETEKAFPLGTQGDLSLCAMDRYLYGERSGLEVGLSEHFLFDTDQVAIRLKVRNDGKPQLKAPIYLADGSQSNQVSAFVVLN